MNWNILKNFKKNLTRTLPWKLLYAGILLPRFLRDSLYDRIARNRYRWFGKRESCRLPSSEEKGRFLDE